MLYLYLFLQCNACNGGLEIFDRQSGISYCRSCTLQTISGADSELRKKVESLHSFKFDTQPDCCVTIFDQVTLKIWFDQSTLFRSFPRNEITNFSGKNQKLVSMLFSTRPHWHFKTKSPTIHVMRRVFNKFESAWWCKNSKGKQTSFGSWQPARTD